jgi:(p)ppGpp synthase/HD superfamily hydrolase
MTAGYSDRINHAFAFAAKHHDQQVRKGTRLPYLTHPANVAVILSRYDQDEDTVVAGILHDVIRDSIRSIAGRAMQARVREKFGDAVVDMVLMVTQRDADDEGTPLSPDQQNEDYLERLAAASDAARWVCAADKVHAVGSLLADLRRTQDPEDRESIWRRFRLGKAGTIRWYREICERLYIAPNTLRTHVQNIMTKLRVHSKLEAVAFAIRHGLIEAPRGRMVS